MKRKYRCHKHWGEYHWIEQYKRVGRLYLWMPFARTLDKKDAVRIVRALNRETKMATTGKSR